MLKTFSMGAATALAVATHRPDLALGLVLEDPPWWMHELDATPAGSVRIGRDEPIVKWIEGLQAQPLEQAQQLEQPQKEATKAQKCPARLRRLKPFLLS